MRLVSKKIKWDVAPSDADRTRVYCKKATEGEVLYSDQYVEVPAVQVEYLLPGDFDMSEETNYNLGVSFLDAMGNETDITKVGPVFLDFNPPMVAPANVQIVDA